jgi:hypothetical protein
MRDAVAARAPLMQRSGAAVERLLDAALHLCEQCVSFLPCPASAPLRIALALTPCRLAFL